MRNKISLDAIRNMARDQSMTINNVLNCAQFYGHDLEEVKKELQFRVTTDIYDTAHHSCCMMSEMRRGFFRYTKDIAKET